MLEAFTEEATQGEVDFANFKESLFARGDGHQDLRIHPASKVGDDRPKSLGVDDFDDARFARNLSAQTRRHDHWVAIGLALLLGERLDLGGRGEAHQLKRDRYAIGIDARTAEEILRRPGGGGGEAAGFVH